MDTISTTQTTGTSPAGTPSIARHLEIEALMSAVRWPHPDQQTVMVLAGLLLAARRHDEGYRYFRDRATAEPERPLYEALAGFFQFRTGQSVEQALATLDRAAERELGLPNYLRGLALAELPGVDGRVETMISDMELVVAVKDQFPIGFLRPVRRALARATSLLYLAKSFTRRRDPRALATIRIAVSLSRDGNFRHHLADSPALLGQVHLVAGEVTRAIACVEESVQVWRTRGWPAFLAETLRTLAGAYAAAGDHTSAERAWREARELYQRLGETSAVDEITELLTGQSPTPLAAQQQYS
jgi:tetratricopeptide (TPR) repeat protein